MPARKKPARRHIQSTETVTPRKCSTPKVPGVALWATNELPVDNTIDGDRAADVTVREPPGNGLIFRANYFPPNTKDTQKRTQVLLDLDKEVKQKYPPTQADLDRDPSMHRTDTCDMFTVASGEVHLMTDTDEVVLKPGDTAVIQGGGTPSC